MDEMADTPLESSRLFYLYCVNANYLFKSELNLC